MSINNLLVPNNYNLFTNGLEIAGDLNVSGFLNVRGDSFFWSDVNISDTLFVSGNITTRGNILSTNGLSISGNGFFNSLVNISGDLNVSGYINTRRGLIQDVWKLTDITPGAAVDIPVSVLAGGIYIYQADNGAPITATLPTLASIIAAYPFIQAGSTFDFLVINSEANVNAQNLNIAANTGGALSTDLPVASWVLARGDSLACKIYIVDPLASYIVFHD